MKILPIEITPQLLETAQHTIWCDTEQSGDVGIGAAAAPEIFAYWRSDDAQYVRFGKIIGLAGGAYATMPLLPELVANAIEAQEADTEGMVNIDSIGRSTVVSDVWRRFFKDQIGAMGNLALGCLMNGPEVRPINDPQRYVRGLRYVASVIDPKAPIVGLDTTRYDGFDALSYVGVTGADDIDHRQQVAADLQEFARQIRGGNVAMLNTDRLLRSVDELLSTSAATLR